MKKIFTLIFCLTLFSVYGASFTIVSYNCGSLPGHYDYLRACCMEKVMHERYHSEPEWMETYEMIQEQAAKAFLGSGVWDGGDRLVEFLEPNPWSEWANGMITPYTEFPVVIKDCEIQSLIQERMEKYQTDDLGVVRKEMAREVLNNQMEYDVICFQEANLISQDLLPVGYASCFAKEKLGVGIAWDSKQFTLIEQLGDLPVQCIAVLLEEMESGKTVLVASAHLRGCNPYFPINGDSDFGDKALQTLVTRIEEVEVDIAVLAMDSNVVATHPRLQILPAHNYKLDVENSLEPTCTNPYYLVNTRIDWIAVKGDASITNIPVSGVPLNCGDTNFSDHKPISSVMQF